MTSPVASPSFAVLTARQITGLSVGVAVVLIALKAFALGASGSISILASLADSALDLIASLTTFYAVRWAARPQDASHRHGHGKGEAMAALVQAGLVFASAAFIGWEAILRIFDPYPVSGGVWAVGVVLISMVLTGGLVWLQTRSLKASGSMAVSADRAHYAADLAASVVVLIGVVSGAWLRAPGLDAAAGLVVAVWLFWGAYGVLKAAGDQLLDREVPEADRVALTQAVLSDPRVEGVHQLRTRMSGNRLLAQMHIDLDPTLSFEAAHALVVEAERRVTAAFPDSEVLIHADPRGVRPAVPVSPWATP
ncbi:cation-efflux pump [Brevundimonas sp. LM2]|uniref:cation diffusion facilitator family transporter n=1 Tax=Brevundimonas sp. LM2 TaxID=1938605 RepID=UPI000983BA41|nr:cation diffusion facilitator family transporter [Brevundimonas sp. LM2]AQR61067.1 cation-efflux pump [Brevundimonas sp. LM2]